MAANNPGVGSVQMNTFSPDENCAPAWTAYKREFLIRIDAAGLDTASGRRKVGNLLKCMGAEAVKAYDTFEWAPAVEADADNNIEARAAEDRYDLDTVFMKFDTHFGIRRYKAVKRQEFLDTKRKTNQTISEFISDLKQKADLCEYGPQKNAFICDKIINSVNDNKLIERLLDIPDDDLTLDRVTTICRQYELAQTHLRVIDKTDKSEDVHFFKRQQPAGRGFNQHRGRGRPPSRPPRRDAKPGYQGTLPSCKYCMKHHPRGKCPAYNQNCNTCGRKGHFQSSSMCEGTRGTSHSYKHNPRRNRGQGHYRTRNVRCAEDNLEESFAELNVNDVYHFQCYVGDNAQEYSDNDDSVDSQESTTHDGISHHNVLNADVSDDLSHVYYDVFNPDDDVSHPDIFEYSPEYDDADNMPNHNVLNADDHSYAYYDVLNADISDDHFVKDSCLKPDDFNVTFSVQGKSILLEIDTAAQCNVLSLDTIRKLGLMHQIQSSHILINGVHNKSKKVFGCIKLVCMYKQRQTHLTFQILDTQKTVNLLGRHDATRLGLIARVHTVRTDNCAQLIDQFKDVIGNDIGCIPGEQAIQIDPDVPAVIHPPRVLPAAIRDDTKAELDRLEERGIITKVTTPTAWVSSMVAVRKKNGKVRVCIDPSDLNRAILREHHPMNTLDDIATRLHGSKVFSTLDANSGYFQIKLTEQSSYLTTFNTPFGRYRYLRMPMGAKCSAEIFQREMQRIFGDIPGVEIVVDDILVHGKNFEEHNKRLKQVLQRAKSVNLKLNKEKSHFGLSEVNYVGHKLTGHGIQPTQERIKAISSIPDPTTFQELETILGMVAYVSKFIPNLSELNAPLRELKKQTEWKWTEVERQSLNEIKRILTSNPCLKYYDVSKPILLSVDASMKGLGAAILQDQSVVAYASRALTPTEQRYAQIEKEALAVCFACTKFHKLIYGNSNVTIESDHKPLETIMNKPIYKAPLRIQRMMLKLQPYDFKLIHVKGQHIGLADCLSRAPEGKPDKLLDDELMVCPVDTIASSRHGELVEATRRDAVSQLLIRTIQAGWPETRSETPSQLKPFWECRDEMATYDGLIMRGDRIFIPESQRRDILKRLHKSHMGIIKTKQRARETVYWPSMNRQIEEVIEKCETCLEKRNKLPKEPMMIHPIPTLPWTKVAADLFELAGKHFIVMVDYYSNFIEVEDLANQSAKEVIRNMKRIISRHGIMMTLLTDNGPQFTSSEFKDFTEQYGIDHITSSPYRPQSNGLAEKAVQTIKRMMIKCAETSEDFHLALLDLRNTPRGDLGSPCQRLMGRRTLTNLPTAERLLQPQTIPPKEITKGLIDMRETQKHYYDRQTQQLRNIQPNDAIRVRTPKGWMPAQHLRKHEAPRSHHVRSGPYGHDYRRNRDQILTTKENPHDTFDDPPLPPLPQHQRPMTRQTDAEPQMTTTRQPQQTNTDTVTTRSSSRLKKTPTWMKDFVPK